MADNDRFFEEPRRPKIYAYTEPQYEHTAWTGARTGKGLIKVGFTIQDVIERIEQQFSTQRPVAMPYKLLLNETAIRNDGTYFNDFDVHRALTQLGVKR